MYPITVFDRNEIPILWNKEVDNLYNELLLKFTKPVGCTKKISICTIYSEGINVKTIWSYYAMHINTPSDKFINNLNRALVDKETTLPIEVIYATINILYEYVKPQFIECVQSENSINILFVFTHSSRNGSKNI